MTKGGSVASSSPLQLFLFLHHFPAYRRYISLHPPAGEGRRCPATCCAAVATTTRRSFALLLASSLRFLLSPSVAAVEEAGGEEVLETYTDKEEGFSLLRPSSWVKVDKAGATALFVSEKNKNDTIGVVVNPVRLSSLKDFGTPEFVAEKLIQAERRKHKGCPDGDCCREGGLQRLPVFEFEYTVDSSRGGLKRIFSAVLVDASKLYVLNITSSDTPESPLGTEAITILEKVLHSFNVLE
ncbi:unnamed protein product [Spirodela intermedia]|uniref:PsbP C-terminal domain-containing protein n=1 Tax=Spirodela intermedia TaxID=51605 RepID=A0A7I8IR44_SPIIN|nr:unnamed protein product [Spirodela intermedia]CAA6660409.1 unnamed protein product [Spirodela intermedia]